MFAAGNGSDSGSEHDEELCSDLESLLIGGGAPKSPKTSTAAAAKPLPLHSRILEKPPADNSFFSAQVQESERCAFFILPVLKTPTRSHFFLCTLSVLLWCLSARTRSNLLIFHLSQICSFFNRKAMAPKNSANNQPRAAPADKAAPNSAAAGSFEAPQRHPAQNYSRSPQNNTRPSPAAPAVQGAAAYGVPARHGGVGAVVVRAEGPSDFPSLGDSSIVGRATNSAANDNRGTGGIENRAPQAHMNAAAAAPAFVPLHQLQQQPRVFDENFFTNGMVFKANNKTYGECLQRQVTHTHSLSLSHSLTLSLSLVLSHTHFCQTLFAVPLPSVSCQVITPPTRCLSARCLALMHYPTFIP